MKAPLLKKSSRGGFTLVELAIVILLLSVLFTMIFGVYYAVVRIADDTTPAMEEKQKSMTALELMRTTLNRTFYLENEERLIFVGRNVESAGERTDRLTFAASHPDADNLGIASVREVSFYLKEDENHKDRYILMLREDVMVDEKPGEGGFHYPILDNVVSLRIRYSYNAAQWHDEWNSKKLKKIPRLIQISLVVYVNNQKQFFETLAQPGLYEAEKKGVM